MSEELRSDVATLWSDAKKDRQVVEKLASKIGTIQGIAWALILAVAVLMAWATWFGTKFYALDTSFHAWRDGQGYYQNRTFIQGLDIEHLQRQLEDHRSQASFLEEQAKFVRGIEHSLEQRLAKLEHSGTGGTVPVTVFKALPKKCINGELAKTNGTEYMCSDNTWYRISTGVLVDKEQFCYDARGFPLGVKGTKQCPDIEFKNNKFYCPDKNGHMVESDKWPCPNSGH